MRDIHGMGTTNVRAEQSKRQGKDHGEERIAGAL